LEGCLSVHFEDLSYTATSPLHLGKYKQFWDENEREIQEFAMTLGKEHKKLVKEYLKLLGNPRDNFFYSEKWLDSHLKNDIKIDLKKFKKQFECDDNELKQLIFESALRICICYNARRMLIKSCEKAYNLEPGLFAEFL